jgi:hypothetical protein
MRIALAAILFACASVVPQLARAHGGIHESAPAQVHDEAAAERGKGALKSSSVSPSCPGSHGEFCSCGGLTLCDGSGKTPVFISALPYLATIASASSKALPSAAARAPPQPFSFSLSRAPPSLY